MNNKLGEGDRDKKDFDLKNNKKLNINNNILYQIIWLYYVY